MRMNRDMLMNFVRHHYEDMNGYVSAGMEAEKGQDIAYMNANESPFPLPGLEAYNRYPQPQPKALLKAYSKAYHVDPDQIFMTRGADESISILTRVFCEPHVDGVINTPPTFGMYGVNSNLIPANLFSVPLIRDMQRRFQLDKSTIIETALNDHHNVKLIYLCSPNNPTANSLSRDDMLEICSAVENRAAVVVDETYAEFARAGSLSDVMGDYPNLLLLRTLSKSYGIAGIRMGVTLCADTDFITFLKTKAMDAYPLPQPSVDIALKALSMQEEVKEMRRKMLSERDRLMDGFTKSDHVIHVYDSDANFFLVEMSRAHDFWQFCKDNGIFLRDFSTKSHTENCLRVSPGTVEQNDKLLEILNDFQP